MDRGVDEGGGNWRAAVKVQSVFSAVPIARREQTLNQLSSAYMPQVGCGNGSTRLVTRPVSKTGTAEQWKGT